MISLMEKTDFQKPRKKSSMSLEDCGKLLSEVHKMASERSKNDIGNVIEHMRKVKQKVKNQRARLAGQSKWRKTFTFKTNLRGAWGSDSRFQLRS